jgi:histidinol-phosphate aminotransferase
MIYIPPYVQSLVPYQPGKSTDEVRREFGLTNIIKLASNENPLGPSPKALQRIKEAMPDLHIYPTGGFRLREKLAARFGKDIRTVLVGSGSEAIMSNIIRAFISSNDDECVTAQGTFIGIYVLIRARGAKLVTVPLKNYHFDLDAIAAAITDHTRLVYLANPNNPTGTMFTRKEFEAFMKKVPPSVLVMMDEAYFEYAQENPDYPNSLEYDYFNVITLRTFSKAYGLAGARIGYGFAHPDLAINVLKVKLPFEPTILSEVAGMGALEDDEFLARTLEEHRKGKAYLEREFKKLGLDYVATDANFFMIARSNEADAMKMFDNLQRQGVIIRPLKAFGLPHCVRITIGKADENEMLIEALKKA